MAMPNQFMPFPITPPGPQQPGPQQPGPISPATPSGPITSTPVGEQAKLYATAEAAWQDELAHVKAALTAQGMKAYEESAKMWDIAAERARLLTWLAKTNGNPTLDAPKPMPLTHGATGTGDERAVEYDQLAAADRAELSSGIAPILYVGAAAVALVALVKWVL